MKKLTLFIITLFILVSCDNSFQEINTDPNIAIPPAETLFTFALKETLTYKNNGEWYHENHQKMTWLQYLTQGESNFGDINTILPGNKYDTYYVSILNHLKEMRYQIRELNLEEQKAKQKLVAAANILQVFFALRVTDQFGSIPYSEAGDGRREGKLDPIYDTQEQLFTQFIDELNTAIGKLGEDLKKEFDFSSSDFVYNGNANRWIKCANAIKLRIAVRLLSQNETWAKEVISSVVADGRLFESNVDQFTFDVGGTYRGGNNTSFEWKGLMWASKPVVDFMKKTTDPRLRIFYEPNGYTQESIDAFSTLTDISPAVDIANDNNILYYAADGEPIRGYRFIGAPTHRQAPNVGVPGYYLFIDNPNAVGSNTAMISKFNRRLIQGCYYDYGALLPTNGNYVDVMISYAEVCYMMSEFILKGYLQGDAKSWYNKGVHSSLTTYSWIGEKADLSIKVANKIYSYIPISQTETNNYLANNIIKFNGIDDLEKVYIQQFLNFFRLPSEAWVTAMRTGYPKYESTLLARHPIDDNKLPFPRRMPLPESEDLNLKNWIIANKSQGFTNPRDENPFVLNSQRLWWDLKNPEIGSGDN